MATSPITSRGNLSPPTPFTSFTGAAGPTSPAREAGAPSAARSGADVFTTAQARSPISLMPPAAQWALSGAAQDPSIFSVASGAGAGSYTVQPGDTLSGIAAQYGTTVDALAQANGISDPNTIYAGQVLTIPDGSGAVTSPPPSGSSATYTVQPGDTLSGIAAQYGTTVDALAQANGISDPNTIYVGQVLTIPGSTPAPTPDPTPAPTPSPSPAPSPGTTYTVQPGDTLSGIAARFGTTVDALAQANGITNPNLISVGQTLTIPGTTPVTPPPPTPTGSGISLQQLETIMPNLSDAKAQQYLPYLNAAMAEANINTPARQAAFIAQLAHESGEFRWMEELGSGQEYEGRTDLGNTQPGDGPRFKGRGPIQLTGRSNYIAAGNALGIDLVDNPTRAADPDVGFRTAAWYWTTHGCNAMADAGNFLGITRAINGGLNGESDREMYWNRAKQVLGA